MSLDPKQGYREYRDTGNIGIVGIQGYREYRDSGNTGIVGMREYREYRKLGKCRDTGNAWGYRECRNIWNVGIQ